MNKYGLLLLSTMALTACNTGTSFQPVTHYECRSAILPEIVPNPLVVLRDKQTPDQVIIKATLDSDKSMTFIRTESASGEKFHAEHAKQMIIWLKGNELTMAYEDLEANEYQEGANCDVVETATL